MFTLGLCIAESTNFTNGIAVLEVESMVKHTIGVEVVVAMMLKISITQ